MRERFPVGPTSKPRFDSGVSGPHPASEALSQLPKVKTVTVFDRPGSKQVVEFRRVAVSNMAKMILPDDTPENPDK